MSFLEGFAQVLEQLNREEIAELTLQLLALKRRRGRLFFLGVGGSAANASHAVNDFRKIAGIEAYTPTDNVAELTARINDQGWAFSFHDWLRAANLRSTDAVFVLSVGGGTATTSQNILVALNGAAGLGTPILGIVGRDGGETRKLATACVLVPTIDESRITPYVESAQSVLLHLLATDPVLMDARNATPAV